MLASATMSSVSSCSMLSSRKPQARISCNFEVNCTISDCLKVSVYDYHGDFAIANQKSWNSSQVVCKLSSLRQFNGTGGH